MKPGFRQYSLGSLMIGIAVFAFVLANPGLTVKSLMYAGGTFRLVPNLVVVIVTALLAFHYMVLSPCLWLIAAMDRRLGSGLDDGREP